MHHLAFDQYDAVDLEGLQAQFLAALPFPHVVLENFVSVDQDEVLNAFPPLDWPGWQTQGDAYQQGKRACSDIEQVDGALNGILHEVQGPKFLEFLEHLTGIRKLLVDPHLAGGGLHCTGPGGKLSPHLDFHFYKKLSLYRRLNVLIFLNPGWPTADGGLLQLFDRKTERPVVTVVPRFGTCVIFRTDDQSLHGVTPIAPSARPRKSIAAYYYTSTDAAVFSGGTDTYWRDTDLGGLSRTQRLRTTLTNGLVLASRAFAKAAHVTDPRIQPAADAESNDTT